MSDPKQYLITSEFGIVKSHGYPTFTLENRGSEIRIQVPIGKTIDIWVVDIAIKDRNEQRE